LTIADRYLVVADGAVNRLDMCRQIAVGDVHVLCPSGADDGDGALPREWTLIRPSEVGEQTQLREEFLRFLNDWPERPVCGPHSFENLFRQADGYSVWWTGPGIERNTDSVRFAELQMVWAFDRTLQSLDVSKVYISVRSVALASVLVSRCEGGRVAYEFVEGSARPSRDPWAGRASWLVGAIRRLVAHPARVVLAALVARLTAMSGLSAGGQRDRPGIIFTSQFARCVQVTGDDVSVWFWQRLCERINALAPQTRCCHILRLGREMPGYRAVSFFYHTAWPLFRRIECAVAPRECFPALGDWFQSVPRQLVALWRYWRLETQASFRESFSFAGADVSPYFVSRLRDAVAGISDWAQTTGSIRRSIESVGDVRAMLVFEEMYRPGMMNIAAARSLGIPTIGVQHGMIMPGHLVYTLPPGQVRGGPIPDYFAATSAYAKDVLTRHGAYPAHRVWVTGSPRFDGLVLDPPNRQAARTRLGLSQDCLVILVTTQTAAWFPNAVRAIFESVADRPHCVVCVKTHPKRAGLSPDAYRSLAREVGATNILCFDDRFDDLLAACDVLVSGWSTTILEAMLLGRRTICVNFSGQPDGYPYVEEGASVGARSPSDVRRALGEVLSGQRLDQLEAHRKRFLERHAGPSAAGRAGLTMAAQVLEVAGIRASSEPAA
jgi:hypothetical protein